MASQTFTIGDSGDSGNRHIWNFSALLSTSLVQGGVVAYARRLTLHDFPPYSSVLFYTTATADATDVGTVGPHMTSKWETGSSALRVRAGGHSVSLVGPNRPTNDVLDPSEPYSWITPDRVNVFLDAYNGLTQSQKDATTLTLSDVGGTTTTAPSAVAPSVTIGNIPDGDTGTTVQLSATFGGGAYDTLSRSWSVTGGTLSSRTSRKPTWTRPAAAGSYTVRLSVIARGTGINAATGTIASRTSEKSASVLARPEPLAGNASSGTPTVSGGLSRTPPPPPAPLAGDASAGTPTVTSSLGGTFTLPQATVPLAAADRSDTTFGGTYFQVQWSDPTNGLGDVAGLRESGPGWLIDFWLTSVAGSNQLRLYVSDVLPSTAAEGTSGQELRSSWETYARAITVRCDGISNDLVLPGPAHSSNQVIDSSEYYNWWPSAAKIREVASWLRAFGGINEAQRGTAVLILNDGSTAAPLSGDAASGTPSVAGNLAVAQAAPLAGDAAAGTPAVAGDIAVAQSAPLSGDAASGAPAVSGDLGGSPTAPLSGDAASGTPAVTGQLAVAQAAPLAGDAAPGAPAISGHLGSSQLELSGWVQPPATKNVVLALLERTTAASSTTLYADSSRGGTDAPIDGELGLGDGETNISRFLFSGGKITLNDSDDPGTLNLSSYFGASGEGLSLTFWVQTHDGTVTSTVLRTAATSPGPGGSFFNFIPSADQQTQLRGLATSDQWIVSFTQPTGPLAADAATAPPAVAGDLSKAYDASLTGDAAAGAPTVAGDLAVAQAAPLSGDAASGSPVVVGDLSESPTAPLAGDATAGAAVVGGGLSKTYTAPLSGDAASGTPAVTGQLAVAQAAPLAGDAAPGAPAISGHLGSSQLELSGWVQPPATKNVVLALLERTTAASSTTLYADSSRGGTDAPIDGELGLGDGETNISRFLFSGGKITLNDSDDPGTLNLSSYFGASGEGLSLTFWVQTHDGTVTSTVLRTAATSPGPGGSFFNFIPSADQQTQLRGLATSDQWIVSFTQPTGPLAADAATAPPAVAGDLSKAYDASLTGDAAAGAPTVAGDLAVAQAAPLSGDAASGSPVVVGDLSESPTAPLAGDATAGAAVVGGGLSKTYTAPLSGDAASGTPAVTGQLAVAQAAPLAGDAAPGAPAISGHLGSSQLELSGWVQPPATKNVVLALLERTTAASSTTLYADSSRGGTDAPIDGELGLGDGETNISRFLFVGDKITLNDNDDPGTLNLSSYFGASGEGLSLTFWVQTHDGTVTSTVLRGAATSPGPGGSFFNFIPSADQQTQLRGLATSDQWIVSFTQPTGPLAADAATAPPAVAGDLSKAYDSSLSGDAASGAPAVAGDLGGSPTAPLAGDAAAGAAVVSGDLSRGLPAVTLVGDAASANPTVAGNLGISQTAALAGDAAAGAPVSDADLSSFGHLLEGTRDITLAMSRSLAEANPLTVHFLQLESSGGITRITDAVVSLPWDGSTWTAAGGAFQVGTVQETPDMKAQSVDIKLSNVDRSIGALILTNNFRGRDATVWLAHMDADSEIVDDPIEIFSGKLNDPWRVHSRRGRNDATSTVSTRIVSHITTAQQSNPMRTNVSTHREMLKRGGVTGTGLNDLMFDKVPDLAGREISWGVEGQRWGQDIRTEGETRGDR